MVRSVAKFWYLLRVSTLTKPKFNRVRYIVFNLFAIFFFFYITRIAKLEKKKSTKKSPFTGVKDLALTVGRSFEKHFIKKNYGEADMQGMDMSMNADFAIFQGAGLETFDARGLGRTWSRRDETMD
jgi:hypothetical protein